MRWTIFGSLAAAAAAFAATPALAIDGGTADGNGHPNVGVLAFTSKSMGVSRPAAWCTGSVISDRAFLTAAHCITSIPSDAKWYVALDAGSPGRRLMHGGSLAEFPACCTLRDASSLVAATRVVVEAKFGLVSGGDQIAGEHDLAVVLFRPHSFSVKPVQVTSPGVLDHLARPGNGGSPQFTLAGYGAEIGQAGFIVPGYRKTARAAFVGLTRNWLKLTDRRARPGPGGGALCGGDSGSPQFLVGTDVAVSVTHQTDASCNGTSVAQRLDTPPEQAFLAAFVPGR